MHSEHPAVLRYHTYEQAFLLNMIDDYTLERPPTRGKRCTRDELKRNDYVLLKRSISTTVSCEFRI